MMGRSSTVDCGRVVFVAGALLRNSMRRELVRNAHIGVTFTEVKGFLDSEFVVTGPAYYIDAFNKWLHDNKVLNCFFIVDRKTARILVNAAKSASVQVSSVKVPEGRKVVVTAERYRLNKFLTENGYVGNH